MWIKCCECKTLTILRKVLKSSNKTKHMTILWPSYYNPRYLPLGNENISTGRLVQEYIQQLYGYPNLKTGFPCGSSGKESASNAGDLSSIPRLGRSRGEGKGYPIQYSGLENTSTHVYTCIIHV